MRNSLSFLLIGLVLVPSLVLATNHHALRKLVNPPALTGDEPIPHTPVVYPPYTASLLDATDLIGDTMKVGTTWWDLQHLSEIGRMIALDSLGNVHIVWTNGEDAANSSRHVYYNFINSAGIQNWPRTGVAVESSLRGGSPNLALDHRGGATVAFYQLTSASPNLHSAVAVDLIPPNGAFLVFEIPWQGGQDLQFLWPRIAMLQNDSFLVLSRDTYADLGQNWTLGNFNQPSFTVTYTDPLMAESSTFISTGLGASRVSNKIGAGYATYAFPNLGWEDPGFDIHYMIDQDGLNLNFDNWVNLTQFYPPDTSFYPDTLLAQGDTLRAYADCDVFVDMNNYTHVTFTTHLWLTIQGGLWYWNCSLIFTWSEQYPNEFHVIANTWDPSNWVDCGSYNFQSQRPSMGQDTSTGYLYCMYQKFDVDYTHLSQFVGHSGWGMPSGEVYISVSTDNGRTWSVGTNVTNTITPFMAPPGQCRSETFPSMAEKVDDYCHLTYVFDYDAGSAPFGEGTVTLNDVIYHRVPVSALPTSPLMEDVGLHVTHMGVSPQTPTGILPDHYALAQNSPNPFNPTTVIRYQLPVAGHVTLRVYDLAGKLITTLVEARKEAGNHTVTFNGSNLPSGLYFLRMQAIEGPFGAAGFTAVKKMVMVK